MFIYDLKLTGQIKHETLDNGVFNLPNEVGLNRFKPFGRCYSSIVESPLICILYVYKDKSFK